eukprot:9403452-Pyramimonas_sp.AAC.1
MCRCVDVSMCSNYSRLTSLGGSPVVVSSIERVTYFPPNLASHVSPPGSSESRRYGHLASRVSPPGSFARSQPSTYRV